MGRNKGWKGDKGTGGEGEMEEEKKGRKEKGKLRNQKVRATAYGHQATSMQELL